MNLSSKHRKTLRAVFEDPVRSNIFWSDIETMFEALGGEVSEGRGSRVRVYLRERRAVFHRPHPEKEADKGAVKSVRTFLLSAGVKEPGR
jgi:HicA toxin of bacterial toxin-antitoxin,